MSVAGEEGKGLVCDGVGWGRGCAGAGRGTDRVREIDAMQIYCTNKNIDPKSDVRVANVARPYFFCRRGYALETAGGYRKWTKDGQASTKEQKVQCNCITKGSATHELDLLTASWLSYLSE